MAISGVLALALAAASPPPVELAQATGFDRGGQNYGVGAPDRGEHGGNGLMNLDYGHVPPNYGERPGYGVAPPGYGRPSGPQTYGLQTPGYGIAPGYGVTPHAYGSAPPGSNYGVPPTGYGVAPTGSGVAPPGYGYTTGYGSTPPGSNYGAPPPGYGTTPGYGAAPQGYGQAPGYGTVPVVSTTAPPRQVVTSAPVQRPQPSVSYSYDPQGRVAGWTETNGGETTAYGANGAVLWREVRTAGGITVFDASGRVESHGR